MQKSYEIPEECDCTYDTSRCCCCPVRDRLWPDRNSDGSESSGGETTVLASGEGNSEKPARMVIQKVKYQAMYACTNCKQASVYLRDAECYRCGTDIEWVELQK